MKIKFWKYQANGNDFVIVDNRKGEIKFTGEQIQRICNRNFGIGADGLMTVNSSDVAEFEMEYYNSDGKISSMCGNGGRCIAMFAYLQGVTGKSMIFKAYDGLHEAVIEEKCDRDLCDVSISMADVIEIEKNDLYYFLDTGSPHYVEFVEHVAELDVVAEGRKTRYS